jgi:PIN domain nuclease of toxin-antitoxin system
MLYLDTHAVVYLYADGLDNFSKKGKKLLEEESLIISAMVVLELDYLFEIERLLVPSDKILKALKVNLGLLVCDLPLSKIVSHASKLTWTRDPFDRIIVGNAMHHQQPLLTKDKSILKHYELAVW